tara:strand:- start:150 stop:548 length:399 start_codon:yes stop_codon:yes gene_type:complete
MKIFNILLTSLVLAFTFSTASAIDPKKIVGGKIHRTYSTNPNSFKAPYTSNKKKEIMSLYRGSHHERALDAQIRNYRASAKRNAEVFGSGFRQNTPTTSASPTNKSSIIILDNKRFRVSVGTGGNILLSPLK